ncbi:carboxypeptidase-like regulatory domain-containing protein [Psychroserpens damuponensis]|uniref:carboxypeptidase-like regulatory domain-containing protein n=1 Tax=Psychroserpens damuponensis TaxID=943936 RepID=UPI00058D430E|nr:carboxypeptidase-like regulatory domain-containing protein [Psychroserpens damuponensis]
MKSYFTLGILILFSCILNAQELTAKIVDSKTNEPIPFVAVQTAEFKGVISNEEGEFIINLEDVDTNTIEFSCLGYQTLTISVEDLEANNFKIQLEPAVNELNAIYLTNSKPNVDSIIARVNRNLIKNYQNDALSYNFFYRETSYTNFDNLDLEIKKSSKVKKRQLEEANDKLSKMSNGIVNGDFVYFTDYAGTLNAMDDSLKLYVDKATKIINSNENVSLEEIQKNAQLTVLKYLDTTMTYKLKTGLFKIEDSLSLNNDDKKDKNLDQFKIKDLKKSTVSVLDKSKTGTNGMLLEVLNQDDYDYTLANASMVNGEMVYLVTFKPDRSSANFTGSLYISEDTYGVLKLDYRFAKGKQGEKLNLKLLFGVKYIENVSSGTIIYTINEQNLYEPRYIKSESGQYFYLNRSLKFIENSEDGNKTTFDCKIVGNSMSRVELLFSSINSLNRTEFDILEEKEVIAYDVLRKYDANTWSGKQTLAPTTELKTFDGDDKQ